MNTVRHNNPFCWTLHGKPCFILVGSSLAILILMIGVMLR